MISLLGFYKRARLKWSDVSEVETLISEIIWALKIFTGTCLSKEHTVRASVDVSLFFFFTAPSLFYCLKLNVSHYHSVL